jgi:hypothetical protein
MATPAASVKHGPNMELPVMIGRRRATVGATKWRSRF